MIKEMLPGVNCGFVEPGFWEKVENEHFSCKKIKKYLPTDNSFEEDYLKYLEKDIPSVNVGDIIKGKISKLVGRDLVIEFGYKDDIYVNIKSSDYKIIQKLRIGDEIDVMVIEIVDKPYEIKGSITELIKMNVAKKLRDCYKDYGHLEATVTELIPAGFMLDIEMDNINITAFMPNTLSGVNRLTTKQSEALIGTKIGVMLETLQQEKGVYVVSRRKYLKSLIPKKISELVRGNVYKGTVTGTQDFGVFVEFNECLTGMIHKVNLNPDWDVKDVKDGMELEFYLRDILKGNKLILSQIPRDSLWDTIKLGQIIEGKIRVVKPFGALISLDEETTGLIQNTYIEKAGVKLKNGDKISVKVISVIKDERKIYLDIKK